MRLLSGIARHNDRAWLAPRKERFRKELHEPMIALVADASAALARANVPIMGDAKRSIFRFYRDVRFSPDKSPYRTHLAAYLSFDGGRHTPGGIYVHVEPRDVRLSVAFFRLEPPMLARWRASMRDRPATFRSVVRKLARRELVIAGPDEWDDSLVRLPRGFTEIPKDLEPFFRLRSFCTRRRLADDVAHSPALVDAIVDLARDARPLLEFGWPLV